MRYRFDDSARPLGQGLWSRDETIAILRSNASSPVVCCPRCGNEGVTVSCAVSVRARFERGQLTEIVLAGFNSRMAGRVWTCGHCEPEDLSVPGPIAEAISQAVDAIDPDGKFTDGYALWALQGPANPR